jgi:hypothetical protein
MTKRDGSNRGDVGQGASEGAWRAKALTGAPADNDAAPAFTLSRGELASMLLHAAEQAERAKPLLVDKTILSVQLGISPAHIDNLRKKGLPTVLVGQAVRFEPGAVLAWLRRGEAANE